MGFFSWMTQDTDKSIANEYSTRRTFPVTMIDDKGNKWDEPNYEGYGLFGGKDYYELLAEMNGCSCELEGEKYTDNMRSQGINLCFKDNPSGEHTPGVKFPNLVEDSDGWVFVEKGPSTCPDQGFFYGDDEGDCCEVCGGELEWGGRCLYCEDEEENH